VGVRFGQFFCKSQKYPTFLGYLFKRFYIIFYKKCVGLHFGRFFHKLSRSPRSKDLLLQQIFRCLRMSLMSSPSGFVHDEAGVANRSDARFSKNQKSSNL
jgi:hypothetical protein